MWRRHLWAGSEQAVELPFGLSGIQKDIGEWNRGAVMILLRLTGGTQGELWRLQVLRRGLVHGVYARCGSEIAGQELQLQGARGKAVMQRGSPEDAGQMQVKLDHDMRKL